MRRLFFLAAVLPLASLGWLLWTASCERDNYRQELPLRSFDAAPKDPSRDASTPDLRSPADMATPPDLATVPDLSMPPDLSSST